MGSHVAQQTTMLPPFKYDWTSNDIQGIHALAATVYGYVPPSLDVVDSLNDSVNELVQAVGWQGQAADVFRSAWEKDSTEAVSYTGMMNSGGDIFDSLAVKLAGFRTGGNRWTPIRKRLTRRVANLRDRKSRTL
jgi:uncharacterized protein YukE